MKNYDVLIIGGGIGGLMCAYQLITQDSSLKIVILEKGRDIHQRTCPIVENKVKECIHCQHCAIMEGYAGAGAFSDGKYIISTEYGGWLTQFLSKHKVIDLIEQADGILQSFGATSERYLPDNDLKRQCLAYDLHMQQAQVKHLGTDDNFKTMARLIDDLRGKVELRALCTVHDVNPITKIAAFTSPEGEEEIQATHIVFAVGRAGSDFFSHWCLAHHVNVENNQVDIGVRVELPFEIWAHFSKKIYEPKIWYRSKGYGDVTRMFCFNERGHVVVENTNEILTVNGHSFKQEEKKTANSNFALLSTTNFTTPFNQPIEYARSIARLANQISGGTILVQRLGDLRQGRRTDDHRLRASTTTPTCNAVPGDLSLCMPKRQLDNIVETLQALDQIAPGTSNADTLLYGVECKYYSARPEAELFELKAYKEIYAVGDGAGFTRSLSQAAANGLAVGQIILKNFVND